MNPPRRASLYRGQTACVSTSSPFRNHHMKKHTHRPELEILEDRCLLSGDMVLSWNTVAINAVRNDYNTGHPVDQGGPTMDSRALAIASIAVADAEGAIDHSFKPYLPT